MQKTLLLLLLLLNILLLRAQNDTMRLAGGRLQLETTGFPRQIDSMLAENIHFHFTRQSDGKEFRLKTTGVVFTAQKRGLTAWRATDSSDELEIELNASLRAGRLLSYKVKVTALGDLELKEITMHIPLRPDSNYTWREDTSHTGRTEVWVRAGATGIRYSLLGEEWANKGKGGVTVGIKGRSLLANNYSGTHSMKKGETLEYDFDLAIGPR